MFIRKLALANLRVHRVRAALTITAVALAVSLVVSVTSAYTSGEGAAYKFLSQFVGSSDAQINRQGDPHGTMVESIVRDLAADPSVQRVTGRLEVESLLIDKSGQPLIGRPAQIIGVRRPQDTRIENLTVTAGQWFDDADSHEAVIDQVAAEKLHVDLGDSFSLPGPNGNLSLKVVGIVRKPQILAAHIQSIYVPLETLQNFAMPRQPPQVNRILIDLRINADADRFAAQWRTKLTAIDPVLKLRLTRDNRKELDRDLQGFHVLIYLGSTVSMLAALFIIFSTLSMGVSERSRSLAMLRAIGAVRWQIGSLVLAEGMGLAAIGVAVGIPMGWLWVRLLTWKFSHLFTAGIILSRGGLFYAAVGSMAAAMAASLLPAWSAMRLSPLQAMSPLANPASARLPVWCALAGLLLVCVDPAIMFLPPAWLAPLGQSRVDWARQAKFFGHFFLGIPCLMGGFFLLAPAFVWVLERLASPIIAPLLGLRLALLRQQLTSGIWRAAGTCAALMVGLAILIVMEVQGNTMLSGWRVPDKFPDIFIVSWLSALDEQEVHKLASLPGIRPGELMPIAIASPEFGSSIFALGTTAIMPDATMFFGIDPDQGLRMMELEFHQGNAADAARMLKMGRHIIVTDEFRQLKGLGVGDKLSLKTPLHGTVDYTIAGVVWSPGIDVIVSMFDMGRQFDQRTAASIFGSLDDARDDFGVTGYRLFAANLDYFVDKDQILGEVKKELGVMGMAAGDVRQIKRGIQTAFGNMLLLVTVIPFAAMAVASLGVANAIMASVRSRRWHLGVLRSIGFTRGQLLRLILAEAILVGLVGAVLGLCAGGIMSIDAHQLGRVTLGYAPDVQIPWGIIEIGVAAVMVISLLASLWPAISTARTEPLQLLQAGRAAA